MKKLSVVFFSLFLFASFSLSACNNDVTESVATEIKNGSFEAGDLTGWEIERGDAFSDECVAMTDRFSLVDTRDGQTYDVSMGKAGNWHLYGRAFDGFYNSERTGSIRSSYFVLSGDGTISMKIAGGATVLGAGSDRTKDPNKRCFVGVYLKNGNRLIAKQENTAFYENPSYVDHGQYESGVCHTDNYVDYTLDASEWIGQEMCVRIVDNDTSSYYGYISVDDIRVNSDSDSQPEGDTYEKTRTWASAEGNFENEVENGNFETGSLNGWLIVEGEAFSNYGVTKSPTYFVEEIPYNQDGEWHYGYYRPEATGVMRSNTFTLAGSGFISYKLGGCQHNDLAYLKIMRIADDGEGEELLRVSNYLYSEFQFPYAQNGCRELNMLQYYLDLSDYIGDKLYIEVVDNDTDWWYGTCVILDSVRAYHSGELGEKPLFQGFAYPGVKPADPPPRPAPIPAIEPEAEKTSEYQVKNGTFETGDLTGWRYTSGKFGEITDDRLWWNKYPYYNGGKYHFAGTEDEGATGVLQSERFKVKENGIMTFRLGGGKNPNLCYISLRESGSGKELARFGNTLYQDGPSGWEGFDPYNAIGATINLANYVKYIADLKEYAGKEVYIEIVDKASSDWGFLNVDSIITDYDEKPEGDWNPAQDIKPVVQEGSKYQVANGSFESGDLTGWTLTFTDGTSDDLSKAIVFKDTFGWGNYGDGRPVQIAFNKSGRYFFDGGREGLAEACKYTLTSSCFTLGGSGYISFRLGGNGGHVNIRKAGTDEVVAAYYNTAFKDMNFGCIAGGSMQATMTTYVADLRDHINEELYIELVDDNGGNGWNAALLDEVITYYETIPGLSADRVVCYAHSVEGKEEEIPWKYAVNAV